MKIKKPFYFLFCFVLLTCTFNNGFAQVNESTQSVQDTGIKKSLRPDSNIKPGLKRTSVNDSASKIKRTVIPKPVDTLLNSNDQGIIQLENNTDTLVDSNHLSGIPISNPDSFQNNSGSTNILKNLLAKNRFINSGSPAVFHIEQERNFTGKEFIFYSLFTIILILGIFKSFYTGYFNNLFRVFFNTSLRQNQLTDQLLQAKLPSLILNVFFTLTTGMYVWLLFTHFNPPGIIAPQLLLPFCILAIVIIYTTKYCVLKFTGFITGIQQTTDNYIFIIFLVNKISGILLLPFVVLLAFAPRQWVPAIATVSGLLLGLFFLSRYVKSYGAIENKMPLNPFHFIIYIVGAEIIPLLILYKIAKDYIV